MAQVAIANGNSLANLKIEKLKCFNTAAVCIYGCDVTPDDTLLLTDYLNESLIGIDSEEGHSFTISDAPYSACDVTCINDTTVAVTSHEVVRIIDISSPAVEKQIQVKYDCHGVTHRDGKLLVCAAGHGILSINLTTEKIATIVQCDVGFLSYITSYKDKLYYTDGGTNTVTCCDMKGNTKWTFKDEAVVCRLADITTDNEGRLYVCAIGCSKVIVLSNDGQQSQTIISSEDGLSLPYAIHFNKKRNNLLVANKGGKVFLFHVSSR